MHEGTNEEFLCTASGLPTPEVKWITKDGIISEGPSLYLSDINRQHGGNYICVAENSAGVTNRTMTLVVSRKYGMCPTDPPMASVVKYRLCV